MTQPHLYYSTPFIRLVCLILCYSLVSPFFTLIPELGVVVASTATITVPIKANTPHTATQTMQKARWRNGELLVRFRQNISQSEIDALLQANGAQRGERLRGQSGIERLRLTVNLDPSAVATALRSSQLVDFAEPNYLITADQITPNDPRFLEQWALKNIGNNGGQFGSDINASQAWEITTGSRRTVIAILDSGVDFTHQDLRNNEWTNSLERDDNNLDDDNNGFIDDLHGWDFVTDTNEIKDEQGHGTAVAGLIAARGNNETGITGVMWRAGLMSLRVLDKTGTGDIADAVEAIDYAVANGAQVVNCSWGTDDASIALLEAINWASRKGVVVVTSAGNDSRDIDTTPRYPASFDLNNLITVASTDSSDHLAAWSNRGAHHSTIAAPGTDILTTKMGGDYQAVSGSSFSAPFVTGVVGLIKTLRPWLGAERTRQMILRGARQVSTLDGQVASRGVVNAAGALEILGTLPPHEGLDETDDNNGGEHGNDGNGRRNQRNNGNGSHDRDGKEFTVTPPERTQGAPGLGLPNLDEVRRRQPIAPKAPAPIPSTRCSHKDPNCTSRRQQVATGSPVELLAWGMTISPAEPFLGGNYSSISDSPFRLFGSSSSSMVALAPQPQTARTNVALASNGATASASSFTGGFAPSGVINGDRKGLGLGQNGYWSTSSASFPAWVEVNFGGLKTINEVDVFNVQNNYSSPSEPTETMTFSLYGLTTYKVQYWNGSSWADITGASVSNNNLVWNKFTFADLTTNKIRVLMSASSDGYSRATEVEAWGSDARTNVALSANGATVTFSSQHDSNLYPASDTIDGDRKGGSAGWWNDNTQYVYPDWLQVNFGGQKTIDEIDIFTVQDNYQNPVEPTETQTFSQYGVTAFNVQYWTGTSWVTVPGGSITGNNLVWRKLTFSPVTTDRVRVSINNSLLYYSRITELEAWGVPVSDLSGDNYSKARLDPLNRTGQSGVDLLSGNANWSLPILSLKGRAGLDLGLSLSYNSLVWTKDAASNSIKFDADQGMPSPGFRIGFPVIQQRYYNSVVGKYAYLLITPSGGRVELRQVGTSNVYESADSSYLQLTDNGNGSLTLRPTDGSQITYSLYNGQYQCTRIKDRNGNYIDVSYIDGRINTITDTLARVITFNYDTYINLISITQTRMVSGQPQTHQLATFGWGDPLTINTSFSGLTVIGPQNNTAIPVLRQVGLDDGTRYNFDYTSWGQVYKIRHYAQDGHQLNWVGYNLPGSEWLATSSQADCPRFTEQKVWAENWNGLNNVPAEVVTQYIIAAVSGGSLGQATMPDGTIYKELYATTGWQKGLTTTTENWSDVNGSGVVRKKWTTLSWTQDDTNLQYQKNPRVTEANSFDQEGNRKRTTINYDLYASYGLPHYVNEYAADGTTVLRTTYTDYNLSQAYLDRRIIGLISSVEVRVGSTPQSEVTYSYDAGGTQLVATSHNATQHDANYGVSFNTGRGLLASVSRYDVLDASGQAKTVTQVGYDTNGSVIFTKDPLDHETTLSYADSFSDNNNSRNTYAYPTMVTDAGGFSSTSQYDYHIGAVTRAQGPPPAGHTQGAIQTMEYDAAGRITRVNNPVNNAYKRWVYGSDGAIATFTTIQSVSAEAMEVTYLNGIGRVFAQGGDLPNTVGLYRGQYTLYDRMGRAAESSSPGEMTASWIPAGDDAAGRAWTYQQYDWKGRPTLTILPSTDGGQTSQTRESTYGGCGCAGGEVVTVRDEVGRKQRVTYDVLGRPIKTEHLNKDANYDIYSTVVNTYDARNQITNTKHYQGTPESEVYQETTFTYDGYGRLQTSKAPEQTSPTSYTYNSDDTTNVVTDARGATTTFGYNARQQVTAITYGAPTGITSTASVSFSYDAVGNRTTMTDGLGSVSYSYDQLSRLTSETRSFTNVGSFTLTYGYNLSGQLTSVTDPWNVQVGYNYDSVGRLTSVTGSGGGASNYASDIKYRAWGALKHLTYGNSLNLDLSYNNRLQTTLYDLKTQANARVMGREYQYTTTTTSTDNDGRVKYSRDLVSNNLDRTYTYDHTGSLQSAKAGVSQQNGYGNYYSGPFEQGYSDDVWGNLVGRSWRTFSTVSTPTGIYTYQQQNGYTDSYVNNKNTATGWHYDANGNLLTSTNGSLTRQYTYDAAGIMLTSSETGKNIAQAFDGDGQRVKFVENSATTYYVRSSVLGGQTISEVDQGAVKKRGYVYAGGEIIAKQENSQVSWEHSDPSGASNRTTNSAGAVTSKVEADPLGTQVDDTADYNYGGYTSYNSNPAGFYGAGDQPRDCAVAGFGVAVPCSMVNRRALGWGIGILRSDYWKQNSSYVNPAYADGGGWLYYKPELRTSYSYFPYNPSQTRIPTLGDLLSGKVKYTEEMIKCDEALGEKFGDDGAYMAANSFDLTKKDGNTGQPPQYRGDYTFRGRLFVGHLSNYAAHLYANKDGASTATTNVYAPSGGVNPVTGRRNDPLRVEELDRIKGGIENTFDLLYYSKLGDLSNVTLLVVHVNRVRPVLVDGRVLLGTTGGPGGDTQGEIPHAHFELLPGRVRGVSKKRTRIPFNRLCPK